jgi:hypothetical protein
MMEQNEQLVREIAWGGNINRYVLVNKLSSQTICPTGAEKTIGGLLLASVRGMPVHDVGSLTMEALNATSYPIQIEVPIGKTIGDEVHQRGFNGRRHFSFARLSARPASIPGGVDVVVQMGLFTKHDDKWFPEQWPLEKLIERCPDVEKLVLNIKAATEAVAHGPE